MLLVALLLNILDNTVLRLFRIYNYKIGKYFLFAEEWQWTQKKPYGYKLLIEDYAYAVDGLEFWSLIETWVKDYCSFYYTSDDMVAIDPDGIPRFSRVLSACHKNLDRQSPSKSGLPSVRVGGGVCMLLFGCATTTRLSTAAVVLVCCCSAAGAAGALCLLVLLLLLMLGAAVVGCCCFVLLFF